MAVTEPAGIEKFRNTSGKFSNVRWNNDASGFAVDHPDLQSCPGWIPEILVDTYRENHKNNGGRNESHTLNPCVMFS